MATSQLINLVQDSLDSTMPYIGMYIAAASAVCTLAMAADAFIAFRTKKYWLPCKYFSLNAFSLTVLAVAMKLPLDLTSLDLSFKDKFARISSLVLMSTAMSNFMTSLGSMEDNEIVLNMAALGILVVTIAGNVCIHIAKIHSFGRVMYLFLPQQIAPVVIMLLFLAMLCCMSLMVPGAKRYIGLRYDEMHKSVLKNRQVEWGRFSSEGLENMVKGYWVMAQTSSPQFVLARSSVSSLSGVLCLFTALVLVLLLQDWYVQNRPVAYASDFNLAYLGSNYGPSVYWILTIQTIGVVMGTIAPVLRWLAASWFKISETERRSFRDELKVDKYWTWRLEEWRDRPLPFHVQNRVCKKILRDVLRFVLNFCIGVQILFVSAGMTWIWIGVEVYRKWDDMDLKSTRIRGTTHRETLQNLSSIAEKTVTEFMAQSTDILMQNPLNWPARVTAANSMYRIAQTILVGMGDDEHQDDDELFESISITISDILAGCLTNLVQVITLKCHTNDIKEREKSVRRATILLGESKQILEILQERELPSLDVEKASYIDEWRASMALNIENPPSSASASSSDDATIV